MFFLFQEIMETLDTSFKIKFLIEMALQGEISWHALDPVINRLTPTLEKSRQIIRILLKEFETHQLICIMNTTNDGNNLSEDIAEIDEDEDQSNNDEEGPHSQTCEKAKNPRTRHLRF